MKHLMKPVEMILSSGRDGALRPLRFRWTAEDGEARVIHIDRVITTKEEKLAGNPMFVYDVQSRIGEEDRRFEMKYEIRTRIWYVSRM